MFAIHNHDLNAGMPCYVGAMFVTNPTHFKHAGVQFMLSMFSNRQPFQTRHVRASNTRCIFKGLAIYTYASIANLLSHLVNRKPCVCAGTLFHVVPTVPHWATSCMLLHVRNTAILYQLGLPCQYVVAVSSIKYQHCVGILLLLPIASRFTLSSRFHYAATFPKQ